MAEAGLEPVAVLGIEGPGWLVGSLEPALRAARAVEREPSLLGVSSHLLAVARRD